MAEVPLSDAETRIIFSQAAITDIKDLENGVNNERDQLMWRLENVFGEVCPVHYIEKSFSNCEELQQLRAGDQLRALVLLKREVHGYHILHIIRVTKHDYSRLHLADERACKVAEEINDLGPEEVEDYLNENGAVNENEFRNIHDEMLDPTH